jgi:poly(3-hydroxybutyrate) depolymerase
MSRPPVVPPGHARRAALAYLPARATLPFAAAVLCAALYATRADATTDILALGCQGAVARVPEAGAGSFLGHACRDDECGAHKAGFAWADRNGVDDPAACAEAEDPGFVEGCEAFATSGATAEQAGFAWARDNRLVDRCRCGGAGPRFAAGCEAYVMLAR